MKIIINGVPERLETCTLEALVQEKNLVRDSLIIELNEQIIRQEQWPETRLKNNDKLELLSFVGGG